jgi:hypothetical protein
MSGIVLILYLFAISSGAIPAGMAAVVLWRNARATKCTVSKGHRLIAFVMFTVALESLTSLVLSVAAPLTAIGGIGAQPYFIARSAARVLGSVAAWMFALWVLRVTNGKS